MTKSEDFVELKPATMDPCDITDSSYQEAKRTWLCTGCCAPRPGVESVDVQLGSTEQLKGHVFTLINGCGLGLAYREFLNNLPATAVREDLWLGNVYDSQGRVIEEWKTFRGRHHLIVRGTKNVSYRRCNECRRIVYFAMGEGYLYPAPPKDVCLFEDYCDLILPKSCFDQLPVKSWPLVTVEELPVATEPKDSLGTLK